MSYLTKRKYHQLNGQRQSGLTYYMVEMDDTDGLKRKVQKVYEHQQPKVDLCRLIKSTQPTYNQPLWTMDELQQAIHLSHSNKTSSSSNSSSNDFHYMLEKDNHHQYYEQVKVYKPTWDTWEQEDQDDIQIQIKSQQGQMGREVWDNNDDDDLNEGIVPQEW